MQRYGDFHGWTVQRRAGGWALERDGDGLARLINPEGRMVLRGRYGVVLAAFLAATPAFSAPARAGAQALLVHGLLGEREDFCEIAGLFSRQDWQVQNFRYASTSKSLAASAQALRRRLQAIKTAEPLVLIAHSFGCRMVADALRHVTLRASSRIVFLAPPVAPVKWAQRGHRLAPVRYLLGDVLADLAHHAMPLEGLSGYELLAVEAYRLNWQGAEQGDGWLKAHESALPIPHQRIRIETTHSLLPHHPETVEAVRRFIA